MRTKLLLSETALCMQSIGRRIGYGFSALFYASIALSADRVLMKTSSDSRGDSTAQDTAERVLQLPFGRWIVCATGIFVIGLSGYYFYRAITAKFRKRFKLHQMSSVEKTWATWVGRIGIAARGVVYAVSGASLAIRSGRSRFQVSQPVQTQTNCSPYPIATVAATKGRENQEVRAMNVSNTGTEPTRLPGDSQVMPLAKDMGDRSETSSSMPSSQACQALESIAKEVTAKQSPEGEASVCGISPTARFVFGGG
ncbi:MAG: DUF1206 domain-containing protein [Cyanobacteria bacterium J06648_16]